MFLMNTGFSQFSFHKNYTTNDGLPSSKIYDMLQDRKGYIWFATENGVSRFDGYEFRNFTTRDGLPANSTLKLYEDFKGRIWFLSYQGPLSYYENKKILQYELNEDILNMDNLQFFDKIHIDSTETIWLTPFERGLYMISSNNEISNEFIREMTIRPNDYTLFYFLENGELMTWMQAKHEKSRHSKELIEKEFHSIDFTQRAERTLYHNYECVVARDDYLFSLGGNLKRVKNGKVILEKSYGNQILSIFKDLDQNIWVSEQFNCLFMYPEGDLEGDPIEFLHNTTVSKVLQDTEGDYWFSTTKNGVYCVPSIAFANYNKESLNIDNDIILSMETFEDQLFFTTDNKGAHSIFIQDDGIEKNNNFNLEGFITSNNSDLLITFDKHLWISDSEFLIYYLDGSKAAVHKQSSDRAGYCFLQLSDKSVLFSHMWGYNKYEDLELKFESDLHSSFNLQTFSLFETKGSTLLLGTIEGLYEFKNGVYSKYDSTCNILNKRISDIKYSNGNLWVGTFDNGIAIETDTGFYYLNEENGLISNMINVIFIENENSIWVGTNNGLSQVVFSDIQTENFQVINYTIWDGLPSNEINDIIKYDELIWLGTNKGLVSFNPGKVRKLPVQPRLNLENVLVNENQISVVSDSVYFESDKNNIAFIYKAISFKDPGNITYQYKLEGLEDNWLETRNTSVRYPELGYGDYSFIIKAKNINNVWSEPLVYKFNIQKHYSETYFFKTFIIICILGFAYLIFILLLRNFKKREYLKQQVILAEQTALRAQMNPHFIFNSLNSIQDFIVKRDDKNANLYLANFSTLMRKILETSKFDTISLKEELETIRIYLELEELRFEGLFRCIINIDESINLEEVFIPTMLLQTYIENAIWHGLVPKRTEGLLELQFKLLEKEKLLISIVDNGIGREKAAEISKHRENHRSMGMKNSNERIQLMNRLNKTNITIDVIDLYNNDNSAAGTRIEIIFDV
ncbi:MAG: histidine kinase [Bacteroidales bacterium]|nr:histidine kinase [Bacteroidales bacterium]